MIDITPFQQKLEALREYMDAWIEVMVWRELMKSSELMPEIRKH